MRSLPKLLALALVVISAPLSAQSTVSTSAGRVVLVLPFDNKSGDSSLGWIGDSFPDVLNKRLESVGFLTISHDDRTFAFDHLGLPSGFRPSRATTVRIAQQLDADFVVIGSYTIANAHISIQAQVLSIDALRLSPPVQDSADLNRLFDGENAIAWRISRVLDPQLNVAEPTFLAAPGAVPLPAFEDYIRGINAATSADRVKRLQEAVSVVPTYSAALLALGKEQYTARDFEAAAATLAKVPTADRLALEANFYLGLARFNLARYAAAAEAFTFVAAHLPLSEVVNNQAVALSRQQKDAVALFQKASAADPSDEDYHYNLAVALFRRGDTAAALTEANTALNLKPRDNEAVELERQLKVVPAGTRLGNGLSGGFSALERIRRNYSEAGYRQAAFQLEQLRSARLATLPAAERAGELCQAGNEFLFQGQLPEAETQFQSALTADPNSAAAHAGLARVRESSTDPTRARIEANASMKLQPNVPALLVLARLDLAEGQLPASATEVTHSLQMEPSNADALALRQTLKSRGVTIP